MRRPFEETVIQVDHGPCLMMFGEVPTMVAKVADVVKNGAALDHVLWCIAQGISAFKNECATAIS